MKTKTRKSLAEYTNVQPEPVADPTAEKAITESRPPQKDAANTGTLYRPPGGPKGAFWRTVRKTSFDTDISANTLITDGLRLLFQQRYGINLDDQ